MPYIDTENEKFYNTTVELQSDFPDISIPINMVNDMPEINVLYLELPPMPQNRTDLKHYYYEHKKVDDEWLIEWHEEDAPQHSLDSIKQMKEDKYDRLMAKCTRWEYKKLDIETKARCEEEIPLFEEYLANATEEDEQEHYQNQLNLLNATLDKVSNRIQEDDDALANDESSIYPEIDSKITEFKEALITLKEKDDWWVDVEFPEQPEGVL